METALKNQDERYMKTPIFSPNIKYSGKISSLSGYTYIQRLSSETASGKFGNAAILEAE